MAHFRRRGRRWYAEVFKNNVRRSASFDSKGEATAWAAQVELDIKNNLQNKIPENKTFGDLLARYLEEITPKKKSAAQEGRRIGALLNKSPLTDILLTQLAPSDIARWRDCRLREVQPSTVLRDWSFLSNVCNVAVKEWGWLNKNPMRTVKKPAAPPSRERRITEDEIERLLYALGYDYNKPPATKMATVGAIFLFALEAAMRAGEIVALRWSDINLDKRYLRIGEGKTQSAKREVPLSSEAIRLLNQMRTVCDGKYVFDVSSQSLDALFRKAKRKVEIEDLHFHDTRHEAITRLAKKIDVLDLARMVGHKDLRMLMVYYNASAADIAHQLN